MGIGKWIGGVLGFMAFGPLGALAGIILGSFFEEEANMTGQPFGGRTNYDDQYTRRDPYAGERNSFLFSMLVMASYIIRADGKSCTARWNMSVNSSEGTSARSP